ncbi:MAG: hypothetical protein E7Z87_02745 [Cyanobacteria bacterium SIG26]|nr:hypothetical protein [Cyanobacteria bacterium SIG26]
MQINNNMSQQNFGMALKIKSPGGANWVKEQSLKTLQQLNKAGNELKDTKFYHLIADRDGLYVSEGLCDRIFNKYTRPEVNLNEPILAGYGDSNLRTFDVSLLEDDIPTKIKIFLPANDAADRLVALQSAENEVEKLTALTKAFEAEKAYKEAKEAAIKANEEKRSELADNLLNQFIVEG